MLYSVFYQDIDIGQFVSSPTYRYNAEYAFRMIDRIHHIQSNVSINYYIVDKHGNIQRFNAMKESNNVKIHVI